MQVEYGVHSVARLISRFALLAVIIPLLFGCGGGGDDEFSVSPGSLSFSATIDGDVPASKSIKAVAKDTDVEEPSVSYSGEFIDRVDFEYPSDDTIRVIVTVKHPSLLGLGTHSGVVTLANSSHSVTVNVTYDITVPPPGEPLVTFVVPRPIEAGRATEVTVRGSGFSRFSDGVVPTISFGGALGSDAAVINDTEIQVTAPPLDAGVYPVSVSGISTTFTSTAELLVSEPQSFPTTDIVTSGIKSKIIFDAERQTLYLANRTAERLERYTYGGATAWDLDTLGIPGLQDVALSPDGKTLVAIDGGSFYEVNTGEAALVISSQADAPFDFSYQKLAQVVFANDGRAVAIEDTGAISKSWIFLYELADQSAAPLTRLDSSLTEVPFVVFSPNLFAASDGSEIFIGEADITPSHLYRLDMSGSSLVETGLEKNLAGFRDISASRDASVSIINGEEVYDSELTLLSTLPASNYISAIAPDGKTAFGYDGFTTLRAFDLTDPSAPVQVGAGVTLSPTFGVVPKMCLSPDGNTLFIADSEKIRVIDLITLGL